MGIVRDKVLAFGYHVYGNTKRRGGFPAILEQIASFGYFVDYFTTPMSYGWLYKNTDRENIRNFFKLIVGTEFNIGHGKIINRGLLNLLPWKISRFIFSKKFLCFAPTLDQVVRVAKQKVYDLVVLESVPAALYGPVIKENTRTPLIYRASDPLIAWFSTYFSDTDKMEKDLFQVSDEVWVPNEICYRYYIEHGFPKNKMVIIKNPLLTVSQLENIENNTKLSNEGNELRRSILQGKYRKIGLYFGAVEIDYRLIDIIAKKVKDVVFVIIGPYRKKMDMAHNVVFLGPLDNTKIDQFVQISDFGFLPYKKVGDMDVLRTAPTGKVVRFLLHLKPVFQFSQYDISFPYIYSVKVESEFVEKIQEVHREAEKMKEDKNLLRLKEFLKDYTVENFIQNVRLRLSNYIKVPK
ncbi:hypothetical protein SAMN04488510_11034 [Fervidobacterium changbaicum]|uniref:Glucuronosyltransferase GumK N-terminal domain-containing protein n=1 Tax=Fervidobacterium changbaicum TaxID=310769 RepID=A0ABX5QTA4_9BACT|nr:hypothetical protein [Fervidobacterium changbaicum]QAV33757.1 hypothetical protein CBS1_08520 [Fervidobacterium changbaicum]SDH32148.1 hypothetical protein SAMN04488510_11034 [Fervidobacterium changbaicum]